MITFVTSVWQSFGPAMANHLWQSTLFAAVAGLLTLALRSNRAQARYWLWLIASVKFLLPFSLLIALGSHMPRSQPAAITQSQVSVVVEEISQPFATASPSQTPVSVASTNLLPAVLLAVWLGGCAAVLLFWWLRWRRMTAALRGAVPLNSGRELEGLRRLEQSSGIARRIGLVVSESTLEPGIVGVFRPVMLLPAGIAGRLTQTQLEAIITHELCHVRRRDNLAAALHMLVEALFWFHPLVWWIGARLVQERERACDEEVLRLGSEPQAYAEGILKVCEFYLESPLVCVAGVTGSNLKKRIEAIMIHRIARNLDLGKKLLLAAVGAAAIIAPVAFGLLHPTQSRAESQAQNTGATASGFESVFIQPNKTGTPMAGFNIKFDKPGDFVAFIFQHDRFRATNATLSLLLRQAYALQRSQVLGGPDWVNSEKYDVDAKFVSSDADAKFDSLPPDEQAKVKDQRRLQLQALLTDRFKLKLHREIRQTPVYELVIAANGSKLHAAKPDDTYADGVKRADGRPQGPGLWRTNGQLVGQGVSMGLLVLHLSNQLDRMVVDKTGLTGTYDFTLQALPGEKPASLIATFPQQLGLQLSSQTAPVEMLVIDHAQQVEAGDTASGQYQEAAPAATPAFESVSITPKGKPAPGEVVRTRMLQQRGAAEFSNVSLLELVKFAYHLNDSQISGAPSWASSNLYDIAIRTRESASDVQVTMALQNLLADRFKLAVHRSVNEVPAYELVVGKDGARLTEVQREKGQLGNMSMQPGQWIAKGMKIGSLVGLLERQTGSPVIDKSGLNGTYDFTLTVPNWTGPAKTPEDAAPILQAVAEQLGLKLNPQTSLVETLVIDHAEPVTGDN